MSTQRTWAARKTPVQRSGDGTPLCRWCKKRCPTKRHRYCSADCTHEWNLRASTSYMRHHVFLRDRGICAICKADTAKIRRVLNILWRGHGLYSDCRSADHMAWRWYVSHLDIGTHRAFSGDLWDADHILPVSEGGGLCGLDNIRTLCIPCHRQVTREMHARRKRRRKGAPSVSTLIRAYERGRLP